MKLRTAVLACAGIAASILAQSPASVSIKVSETAGIRRFNFPVASRVSLPKGALADPANARLTLEGKDVPAQFTAESRFPDGSVEWLDADFNLAAGVGQTQTLRLEYGPGVAASAQPKGLAFSEQPDAIQAGPIRLGKSGKPLIPSVKFRVEDIGQGLNTVAIADASGATHDLSEATDLKFEVLKRGPLVVTVRYTGKLPLDPSYSVPFTVTAETPNSKSMVRIGVTVDDPSKRVREISIHTPIAFGPLPWTWDVGTSRWTYGALRAKTDKVVLTQNVGASGTGWTVDTTSAEKTEPYEKSPSNYVSPVQWGHFQDGKEVVAFALDMLPRQTGKWTVSFDGAGQAAYRYASPAASTRHQFAVYQHFVNTPVQIGAATTPASLLRPLAVAVTR